MSSEAQSSQNEQYQKIEKYLLQSIIYDDPETQSRLMGGLAQGSFHQNSIPNLFAAANNLCLRILGIGYEDKKFVYKNEISKKAQKTLEEFNKLVQNPGFPGYSRSFVQRILFQDIIKVFNAAKTQIDEEIKAIDPDPDKPLEEKFIHAEIVRNEADIVVSIISKKTIDFEQAMQRKSEYMPYISAEAYGRLLTQLHDKFMSYFPEGNTGYVWPINYKNFYPQYSELIHDTTEELLKHKKITKKMRKQGEDSLGKRIEALEQQWVVLDTAATFASRLATTAGYDLSIGQDVSPPAL